MNMLELDREAFSLINGGFSHPVLDSVMLALTNKGFLLLIPFVAYILWNGFRRKREGDPEPMRVALWAMGLAFFSFLLADWFSSEIKQVVQRIRPCNALEDVNLLVGCSKSYSMPSNHSSNSFGVAVALFVLMRGHIPLGWRVYPLVLAALIALSRVSVGVHYPTDVMAGALLGTATALLLAAALNLARRNYRRNPWLTLMTAVLLSLSLFRVYYILHGPLDLSPDEAHYWEWARRPDLSYYSKGPMIAWLITLGTAIFGDTVFGVRVMAVILSGLSSLILFALVRRIYPGQEGERIGALSALLLQAIPLFAPFGVIFTIDSPFVFFWVLSLYLFWRAVSEEKASDWILLGLSVGFGLLAKYTMACFLLSGLVFLFTARRDLLKKPMPYVSGLISLIVFSPVIIWNIRNGWVTMRHTAGQAHVADGLTLSFSSLLEFLGSQAGVVTPVIFVMIFIALIRLMKKERGESSLFLFWFAVPVIAFFLFKSVQGKVQANWAMTGYITGIIAFCRLYLSRLGEMGPGMKRFTLSGVALAVLLTVAAHYPSLIGLPAKLDPAARLKGWEELGKEVSAEVRAASEGADLLIFSDKYQISSELAFYVEGNPRTYCINLGRRMNQYDLWPDMNSAAKEAKGEVRGILVCEGDAGLPAEVRNAFARCEKRVVKTGGLPGEYSIFICYNFRGLTVRRPETY